MAQESVLNLAVGDVDVDLCLGWTGDGVVTEVRQQRGPEHDRGARARDIHIILRLVEGHTTQAEVRLHVVSSNLSDRDLCYARSPLRPYSATIIICHTRGSNSQPHYDTDHY